MSLGVAIPAMAAETPPEPLNQVQVGLTKEINMPPGTTTPASTFSFTFAQMVPAPVVYPATESVGFVIGSTSPAATMLDRTISFTAGAPNVDQWWSGAPGSTDRHGNILEGATWPHAGVFTFLVRETANTNTAIAANPLETMNYDDSAFILQVQISNCPVNGLVPTTAVLMPGTEGTDGEWVGELPKLRYVPGTPGTPPYTSVVNPSELLFVNEFIRTVDPTDPDAAALVITKTIDTLHREHADLTTLFNFTVELTAYAPLLPYTALPSTLGAIIVESDGVTPVDMTGRAPIDYTVVTTTGAGASSTATVTFQMRDGERLHIPALAAGTTWVTTEAAHSRFMPRVDVTVGGGTPIALPGIYHATDNPTGTATGFLNVNTAMPTGNRILTDTGANAGDFVNRYDYSPITGLVIGSMPVLVALIVATLVLAMMVASRSRQRIEQMPAF